MAEKTSPSRFLVGDLRVDFERGEIQRGDEVCRLGGQPLAILSVLLRSPSHSVSREELHGLLWPEQSFGDLDQRLNAAIRLLRRSLGDSTEGPRYLETLRGRGYRICAPVEVLPVPKTGDAEPSLPRLATPVLLVLGLVLLGFLASNRTREPVVTESRPLRLAVSPLEVIGSDAETETLAAVLDEQLKTRLTVLAPRRVELLGPSSSERFASDRGVWLGEAVDWLLEGKLVRAVESRRLFLHLHSIADSSIAWSSEMDASRPIALWFPELAQALTEVMGLSSLKSARTDPGTSVAGAYGGYLAAMNAVRSRDLAAAEQYLRSSLRADPDYLSAHVLLGMIRWEQRDTAGAEAAFHDALQRDPHFGDAHLGLARLRFWGRWDWSGAEESFLRAIDEAPGRAEVHHAYAWFLLASRRFEEAKASMDRALELDPLAAVLHSDLGWFHYRVRDYPGALTLCHAALEIDPQLRGALDCRHRALARLGQFDLALVHGLELTEIPTELEQDLLSHPADEGYRQFLLYLDSTGAFGGNRFVRAMNLTAAGRDEEALTQLEEAVEERDSLLVLIDVTPEFDPLVSTSRFQEVRRQVKGYERLSP